MNSLMNVSHLTRILTHIMTNIKLYKRDENYMSIFSAFSFQGCVIDPCKYITFSHFHHRFRLWNSVIESCEKSAYLFSSLNSNCKQLYRRDRWTTGRMTLLLYNAAARYYGRKLPPVLMIHLTLRTLVRLIYHFTQTDE
jgi:hypothetical protein